MKVVGIQKITYPAFKADNDFFFFTIIITFTARMKHKRKYIYFIVYIYTYTRIIQSMMFLKNELKSVDFPSDYSYTDRSFYWIAYISVPSVFVSKRL